MQSIKQIKITNILFKKKNEFYIVSLIYYQNVTRSVNQKKKLKFKKISIILKVF